MALLLDLDSLQPAQDVAAALGQTIPFEVALGSEHDISTMELEWSVDGNRVDASGPTLSLSTSERGPGVHIVRLALRQNEEEAAVAWRVQVSEERAGNRPPAILQALPPDEVSARPGEEVTFSLVANDVDAEDVLAYAWYVDGDKIAGSDPARVISTDGLSVGEHTVKAVVKDGAGASQTYEWKLHVARDESHSPPFIVSAWPIGSPRISQEGRLRFEVEAHAPNAEDMLSYRWEVDGVPQQGKGPVLQLAIDTAEGGQIPSAQRVTCRVFSGREESAESAPAVGWTVFRGDELPSLSAPAVEESNSPPEVTSQYPDGDAAVAPGESQVFRVGVDDADGDVLTYQWYVNDVPQAADGPVFTYTATEPDNRARVEVQVTDGQSAGSGATAEQGWDVVLAPADKQAITLPDEAVIIDNDAAGTSSTGAWLNSGAAGPYGSNSLYSKDTGATYTFQAALPASGPYEVRLWWTVTDSRDPAVPVTVYHSAGTTTVKVNQAQGGGTWSSIGSYDFGSTGKVVILSQGSTYSTCADAVSFQSSAPASGGTDAPAAAGEEFILDDQAAGASSLGAWSPSGAPSPYAGRSLYSKDTNASFTFQRSLTASGTYDVYAWWTEWDSRDPAVPYEIARSGGTTTVKVDQRGEGGKWNLLGRFGFDSKVKVTVKVPSTATTTCADAVRFVPAGSSPPPAGGDGVGPNDIVLDNGRAGTSADGVWSPSSAPNPFGADSLYAKDRGAYVYDIALPASGKYGVYVWYTQWASRDSAVPYDIRHSTGTSTVTVDQRTGGGQWTPLGDFTFGSSARITVRVVDSNTVCADAVRLVPGGGAGSGPAPSPQPAPPPSTGAQILELAAFPLTSTMARVTWKTNFIGSSSVSYGTTSSADSATRSGAGSTAHHSVLLEGLSADKTYYVRVRTDGSGLSKSSDVVSFRTPDPTPSYTVRSSHPRLFINSDDVTAVKKRIGGAPYDAWWGKVVSFANQQLGRSVTDMRNDFAEYTTAVTFAALISDNADYRDKAIAVAMSVAALSSTGDNKVMRERVDFMAPVYDWLYPFLSSSQRTTLRSRLLSLAIDLNGRVQETEYADGHSNGDQNGAFLAAIAIYGEASEASGIVSQALGRYVDGFWPFWREHGSENGGSFKSTWYTRVATGFNLEVMAAWKSATGKNLFQDEKAWFSGLSDWYLYAMRGDNTWLRFGDTIIQEGQDEWERYILLSCAREYQDGEAQWLADEIRDFLGVYGPKIVYDILWHDKNVVSKAPTSLPLAKHFKGTGMVFFRSSWQSSAATACFRAPPYYMGGHGHLDHSTFQIYYKGGQALDSGIYDEFGSRHELNYYSRTIAHNAILVTDPAEVFTLYGDPYVADGGQYWLTPSRVPHPFPENILDLTEDDGFKLGGIEAFEDTATYAYAVSDGALAYNPTKVAAYNRHFLWIKSFPGWSLPVIAVFDEVEATKSTLKKTYLLHTQQKPAVSGNLVSATNGSGMIHQRTVFPGSVDITLVGGAGKEYYVNGTNYPPNRSPKPLEEAGSWRVEVSPTTQRVAEQFLHVIYPADAGKSAPAALRAIDAGSMKGFEAQSSLVVLFSNKLGSVPSASFTVTGVRRNLLFGLTPGAAYDIFIDGAREATVNASAEGTLDYSNKASGKIDLVRK